MKLLRLLSVVSLACLTAHGQAHDRVISPSKGFQPGHAYALSDIESIDKASGALSLHIPITQLPPGPAGFTAGLTLTYNNRYWETTPNYDPASGETFYGLRKSGYGGWRLRMAPELEFEYLPQLSAADPCTSTAPVNDKFQMWIVNPDGSRNQMYLSQPAQDDPACPVGTYSKSLIGPGVGTTWFTADGTYRRILLDATPDLATFSPLSASWTVSERDGSAIRVDPSQHAAYLRDRNFASGTGGSQITVNYSANGTTATEQMTDVYGRSITLVHDYGNSQDIVTQTAHDGSALVWTVQYANFPNWPGTQLYKLVADKITYTDGLQPGPPLATTLTLPNNLTYSFSYASRLQELSDLTLPTGATAHYSYLQGGTCCGTIWYWDALLNPVSGKTLTHDGNTDVWTYDLHVVSGSTVQSDFTAPDGGTTNHQYSAVSYHPSGPPGPSGQLQQTKSPDGGIVRLNWAENRPAEVPVRAVGINNWIQRELSTTASGLQPVATSIRVFTTDKNGNQTSREERGWVAYNPSSDPASSSAPLLRKTISTYVNGTFDSSVTTSNANAYSATSPPATPRNLAASTEILDASGTVAARSEFNYAETSPSRTAGNLVDELHWDSSVVTSIASGTSLTSSNAVQRHYTYSLKGNLLSETDERNYSTTHTYGSVACPAGTVTDLYRTGTQRGGTLSAPQSSTYGYNCDSGRQTSTLDPNGLNTSISYDRYGRPRTITEGSSRQTNHYYDDVARWIVSQNDVSNANDQAGTNVYRYDQLGRIRLTQQFEAVTQYQAAGLDENTGIQVRTLYRTGGGSSDTLVSNPARQADSEAAKGWTVTRTDTSGRVCATESFDGSAVPVPASGCGASAGATGRTSFLYGASVNWTRVRSSDPAGVTRESYQDALGRMSAVVENPGGVVAYSTYYSYNTLDHMTSARQAGTCATDPVTAPCTGGLSRSFAYTSLSRLSSAVNPESGTIEYRYDQTGNLVQRKTGTLVRCAGTVSGTGCDAQAYLTGYDDLNRIRIQRYSDSNTPDVTYTYDTADGANRPAACAIADGEGSTGRLASVTNGASTSYYYYNKLGNTECSRQRTGSTYDFVYALTPQGQRKQITYPSGRVVTAAFDAAGRIASLCRAAGCYAGDGGNPIVYAAHGVPSGIKLGNGLYESASFNGRLQMTVRSLGTTAGSYDLWRLQNGFAATGNNGNILSQTETVPGWAAPVSTQFRYDNVNRLVVASEKPSNGVSPVCPDAASRWCQTFSYDATGNRLIFARDGVGAGVDEPASFTSANQVAGANWHYDARGNLDSKPGVGGSATFLYNGENMMIAACPNDALPQNCVNSTSSGRTLYGYDGEGRRVTRSDSAGTTTFVYDAEGQLAATYGGPGSTTGTTWLTDDQLGSTRVVTDVTGSVVSRRDYLPFGEEILGTARNERNGVFGYSSDGGVKVKFTGKERDAETSLDYFGARYMSSAQGRFTSPDPLGASGRASDPQSWNRYTYTLNNPLRFFDPDGLKEISVEDCRNDSNCNVISLNVIIDQKNGLSKGQLKNFQSVLQGAKDDLGNGNIALDVSYSKGQVTKTGITGTDPARANLFVSGFVPSEITHDISASGSLRGANRLDPTGRSVTFVSAENATGFLGPSLPYLFSGSNTVTHELLHDLSGDAFRDANAAQAVWHEYQIDRQATGLHFDIAPITPDQRNRAKTYSVPPSPQALKPTQR